MSRLHRLHDRYGQSPWLDNLTRVYLRDGTLGRLVADGIRGVTANPTIFARAIEGSDAYDEQFAALIAQGRRVPDAYWDLVVDDIGDALGVLRPTFDASAGGDGFVSIEVAPELARDTDATIAAARQLHQRIDQPNLFVKIPATGEGVPAVQAMIAEGRSINITLIFSLARYAEVIDAYLAGLEALADIAWRLNNYRTEPVTPVGIAVLSVVIALLVSVGATFGGSLVYDYGFNVETAGDHPVWHKSETDVFPGQHD